MAGDFCFSDEDSDGSDVEFIRIMMDGLAIVIAMMTNWDELNIMG